MPNTPNPRESDHHGWGNTRPREAHSRRIQGVPLRRSERRRRHLVVWMAVWSHRDATTYPRRADRLSPMIGNRNHPSSDRSDRTRDGSEPAACHTPSIRNRRIRGRPEAGPRSQRGGSQTHPLSSGSAWIRERCIGSQSIITHYFHIGLNISKANFLLYTPAIRAKRE